MAESFSLLLPVYAGDRPDYFAKAFDSSVLQQTVRPAHVVVIQDGPVGDDLSAAIRSAVTRSPVPVDWVVLPANVGLAVALDTGLSRCRHDIVARIDADDISLPERFERQLPLLEAGHDLVGTGMFEFEEDVGVIVGKRTPRVGAANIARYARFHDPFSHPTVMYRKSAVQGAGGYQALGQMEDYWLFARMIARDARVENIADPLVMYRVGAGAYARRGGRAQWRSELELQRALRRIRFTGPGQYLRNVVVRGIYRFVPERIRRFAYRRFIAG